MRRRILSFRARERRAHAKETSDRLQMWASGALLFAAALFSSLSRA